MSFKKPTSKKQKFPYLNYIVGMICIATIFTVLIVIYLFLGVKNFTITELIWNNINFANINIDINSVISSLTFFKDFLFNLMLIIVVLFILGIIVVLFKWIGLNEGYVIQPFEVCGCEKEFSGIAISQLLIKELLRIKKIHEDVKNIREKDIPKTQDLPPPKNPGQGYELRNAVVPSGQDTGYNIANLGTAGQGSVSISIGQLLLILKRLIKSSKVIIGSLQRYGSKVSLVAWMGHEMPMSWESDGKIGYINKKNRYTKRGESETINETVKNLAFMISMDITKIENEGNTKKKDGKNNGEIFNRLKNFKHFNKVDKWIYYKIRKNWAFIISKDFNGNITKENSSSRDMAQTWESHKFYTEALNGYYLYKTTGIDKYLNIAGENCLNAMKNEKTFKKPADLLYTIGVEYLNGDNKIAFKEAEKLFKKAVGIRGDDYEFLLILGTVLVYLEEYKEAVKYYDIANEIYPNFVEAWKNKGNALYHQKKYDDAIKCYEKAIQINPSYPYPWNNKGVALYFLRKYNEAGDYFDKAIEIDPKYSYAWSNKGELLGTVGKHKKSIGCYDKAISLDPNNTDAWKNKGNALCNLEKYGEAIKYYDKAIEILDTNEIAEVWNDKGNLFSNSEKYGEAMECYDKSIEIQGDNAEVWKNKGKINNMLENYRESIECYDKSIEINPLDAIIWKKRGDALKNMGKHYPAKIAYQTAFDLNLAEIISLIIKKRDE